MSLIHEGHATMPLKEIVCGDRQHTVGPTVFTHFSVTLELCACSGAAFAAVLEKGNNRLLTLDCTRIRVG